ncbi:alpha/beta hydrolase [Dyadobacter chenwenxiniae]|uniref:Alpha/beta hydrolase n=1 Tax=Dyadobacter chenwenxiniae TaxID=2906456 RepID=A0A9X1PNC0_9BACT|nr:alpha/beta hydrolase [Dyadobacter chenwenxiniae]MCF0063164.1 alpha/beta hydrolase [Dyadobacter chenwenxiniae]UON84668.1 alpha/beta hydrolase [Dyadobacter chenwenxiniae]
MKTEIPTPFKGCSPVNGLKMYYEIHGEGKPLVLIHGGGSTIETTFGRVLDELAKNYQVIAVELEAHGRTGDRGVPLSFEQDADDVAGLLKNLNIQKADIFGFSNGGTTGFQIAIRHPEIVNKLIVASAIFKKGGAPEVIWDFIRNGSLDSMPQQLKDGFKEVNQNAQALHTMFTRDQERMNTFKDISEHLIAGIKAKTLILVGDNDVTKPEHALEMHRLIAGSELMIIPGGHGDYIGEITTLGNGPTAYSHVTGLIERFLTD